MPNSGWDKVEQGLDGSLRTVEIHFHWSLIRVPREFVSRTTVQVTGGVSKMGIINFIFGLSVVT